MCCQESGIHFSIAFNFSNFSYDVIEFYITVSANCSTNDGSIKSIENGKKLPLAIILDGIFGSNTKW